MAWLSPFADSRSTAFPPTICGICDSQAAIPCFGHQLSCQGPLPQPSSPPFLPLLSELFLWEQTELYLITAGGSNKDTMNHSAK